MIIANDMLTINIWINYDFCGIFIYLNYKSNFANSNILFLNTLNGTSDKSILVKLS